MNIVITESFCNQLIYNIQTFAIIYNHHIIKFFNLRKANFWKFSIIWFIKKELIINYLQDTDFIATPQRPLWTS